MNADTFRQLYAYHFAANRKLWNDCVMALTDEQFKRKLDYSVGSVRNQVVHMFVTENNWFSALRDVDPLRNVNPVYFGSREKVRRQWDIVEAELRDYLESLQDADLPRSSGYDLLVWQVLFHVLNHGTDHRAQLLTMLQQLGVKTFAQDYFFFAKGRF